MSSATLRIAGDVSTPRQFSFDDLAALPQLDRLTLADCILTRQLVVELGQVTSLRELRLLDSELNDDALAGCKVLPRNCRLAISNCRFSRDVAAQVLEARPDMTVVEGDFFWGTPAMSR